MISQHMRFLDLIASASSEGSEPQYMEEDEGYTKHYTSSPGACA